MNHIAVSIALAIALIAPWLVSCSDQSADTPDPAAGSLSLRFAVDPISTGSRVSHDGYKSTFEPGDKIGCIIIDTKKAGDDQYMANTCWSYNNDGFLILEKVFDSSNVQQNAGSNTIITPDADKVDEGNEWVKLIDGNADYKLLFYYPYTGIAEIKEELQTATDPSDISYPNVIKGDLNTDNNFVSQNYIIFPVGKTDVLWGSDLSLRWSCYPAFVNIDQSDKAKFNRSEFMYETSTPSNSSGTVSLKFKKKTADIEVDSDIELSDVYFQNAANGLIRGRAFDFSSDAFIPIEYVQQWETPIFRRETNVMIKDKFMPYHDNGKYRIILPAQDNFDCDLCFNIGENAYTIALEQNITELKENHLYIIHINKAGECTIKINDWQDDGSGVIVDKDETN